MDLDGDGSADSPATSDSASVDRLTAQTDINGFFAQLDLSGNILWTKAIAGPGVQVAGSMAIAGNGDLLVLAGFTGDVDLDGDGTIDFQLKAMGAGQYRYHADGNALLLRVSTSGTHLWARRFMASANGCGRRGLVSEPLGYGMNQSLIIGHLTVERRVFVKTGLAGAAVGLMGQSLAMAEDHKHHHDDKQIPVAPVMSSELKKVADTAYDCLRHATACIAECNRVLATGDGDMAACQQAVLSMVPVCDAMAINATMHLADSRLMKNLAKVCSEFCDFRAEACEVHTEHNIECKNCMDSCNECSDACKAYLKA